MILRCAQEDKLRLFSCFRYERGAALAGVRAAERRAHKAARRPMGRRTLYVALCVVGCPAVEVPRRPVVSGRAVDRHGAGVVVPGLRAPALHP